MITTMKQTQYLFYPQHEIIKIACIETNPLSTPLRPTFSPISPIMTPGRAKSVLGSRIGAKNMCKP